MIERLLQPRLLDLATRYPVLTLTGPRQSGKTTLSRMAFPKLPYVSLENPAQREFAQEDPVAFFARYRDGGSRAVLRFRGSLRSGVTWTHVSQYHHAPRPRGS